MVLSFNSTVRHSGNYKHLAYSYTREEQEINPESADMELSEFQESAVQLMEAALDLANRTILNQKLFDVAKEDVEGTSGTPLSRATETPSRFSTPEDRTYPRVSDKRLVANTKAPPQGELSNTVESNLDPSYIVVDNNARQVDGYDEEASSKSNSDDSSAKSVTIGYLFLYSFLVVAR